ncbi:MAG: ATP synthase F1 subunit epsilon [Acidimicrobiaceae bacterium]|jgi:F-type H+-transporting ATPase subunit epsilon|nr:ATP synthase F1 subunit epsilon [Acidimicrobiaceae bacterium]MCH1452766.1 ATP synthase F1 subunit epsilon [Acidimicrobiales bacterium]MEC7374096.1 ATP synthase F1 subunit epsilon [Actinomycetota bacterium]MAL67018.1 ATP synthase F1 subunit epsilon [Acidimicrobiaceae bacterium]MAM31992.1 ATP synthase F1 subunit epsilon [Acidimicrobiaceae bacterium]|tara:strand:+ start:903 stop:1295 length:393 start_codon:yes stop_codon:yes gene_type:complete
MLNVQVVSPESVSYTGEASMVVARTVEGGDIAFQPGHIPFIGILQVWSVDVVKEDGSRDTFAVHRGFVQVSDTDITILSDVSEAKDEIDVPRAERALAEAEQALSADADDAGAAYDKARAEVRIRVAAGE